VLKADAERLAFAVAAAAAAAAAKDDHDVGCADNRRAAAAPPRERCAVAGCGSDVAAAMDVGVDARTDGMRDSPSRAGAAATASRVAATATAAGACMGRCCFDETWCVCCGGGGGCVRRTARRPVGCCSCAITAASADAAGAAGADTAGADALSCFKPCRDVDAEAAAPGRRLRARGVRESGQNSECDAAAAGR